MRSFHMDEEQSSGGDSLVLIRLERLKLQHLRHKVRPDGYFVMGVMFPVCWNVTKQHYQGGGIVMDNLIVLV